MIRSLEDAKWEAFIEHGESAKTLHIFKDLDRKLAPLYKWAANDKSFDYLAYESIGDRWI